LEHYLIMAITINGSGTVTGISVGGIPDGVVDTDVLAANAVTTAKLGTDEASGLAKAWVNFNGIGTVAIRASYNVSSITDNGTGNYTVNFTTAMPDANYTLVCSATNNGYNTGTFHASPTSTFTTTAVQVFATGISGAANVNIDVTRGCVAIFR
jgi:hypothetical protein